MMSLTDSRMRLARHLPISRSITCNSLALAVRLYSIFPCTTFFATKPSRSSSSSLSDNTVLVIPASDFFNSLNRIASALSRLCNIKKVHRRPSIFNTAAAACSSEASPVLAPACAMPEPAVPLPVALPVPSAAKAVTTKAHAVHLHAL